MSDAALEAGVLHKLRWRLVPFLALLYIAAFLDRVNISFAATQMNRELGLSAYAYGLGAGLFFIGYCLFEVPSNLILARIGARRWIARIMISWSIVAAAMAFIQGPIGFCGLRFLLGIAEAGFFPGIVYHLTRWVPAPYRAGLIGTFMVAIPLSTAIGGPLSSAILHLDGALGFSGWRWLFLCETAPSLLLGFACWRYLKDSPSEASWLTPTEQHWLTRTLEAERRYQRGKYGYSLLQALRSPRILALSMAYFGLDMALYGLVLWLPQILSASGLPEGYTGYVIAIPYAVAAAGMVWWCRHSDRAHERVRHIAAAAFVGFVGLAASAGLMGEPLLAIVAFTVGAVGGLAAVPIFWTLPAALVEGVAAAGAIALINSVGNVGGFAGPYVIGWIKAVTGSFQFGLLAIGGGLLLAAALVLIVGHDAVTEHGDAMADALR